MVIAKLTKMLETRKNREQIYCKADYWDSKAEYLEGDAVSMWPNNHLNRFYVSEQTALFERYLPDVKGLKILDVGCGTGRISRFLADRGATVTGIDFSSKAIDIARSLSSTNDPSYFVQSVFEIDAVEVYDTLVSWGVITVACRSRDELKDVLTRLHRSLKPGGQALFLEPIHQGFLHRVLDMNTQDFCAVMEEVGFQVKEVYHLHFWVTRLLLCYFPFPAWITAIGYRFGDLCMQLFRYHAFGDYKAVYAVMS